MERKQNEDDPKQIRALLLEKDARIAELTLALKHEREQTANATQALVALTTFAAKASRKSIFSSINTGTLLENWIANLLSGATWPVLVVVGTTVFAVTSRLNWTLNTHINYAPSLMNSLVWVIMLYVSWRSSGTKYARELDQMYYIVVRASASVSIVCLGNQSLNQVGWHSGWYWLCIMFAAFGSMSIIKNWPLYEWDEKFQAIIGAAIKRMLHPKSRAAVASSQNSAG